MREKHPVRDQQVGDSAYVEHIPGQPARRETCSTSRFEISLTAALSSRPRSDLRPVVVGEFIDVDDHGPPWKEEREVGRWLGGQVGEQSTLLVSGRHGFRLKTSQCVGCQALDWKFLSGFKDGRGG